MNWKKEVFENFKLVAVTDFRDEDPENIDKIDAVYQGGADIVQLRSKVLSDRVLYEMGSKVRALADQYQKLFFVNDRPDIALAVFADGVHLGENDMPVASVRELCEMSNTPLLIGKSTHSLDQAIRAKEEGVDYISVGPVFSTPTKPELQPVGLSLIRQIRDVVDLPLVAVGGIQASNLHQIFEAGAERIAVVRAIFEARDRYAATRLLRAKIDKFHGRNT